MISVIMPVYNEKIDWISKSVKSIIEQTYKDFELIVVFDNPSNIDIKEYLKSLNNPKIKILFNSKNIGLAKSLNKGIKYSKGSFIARLDADDYSSVDRLKKQKEYLENNNYDFVSSRANIISEEGNHIKKSRRLCYKKKSLERYLRYINPFFHSSWFFKKSLFNNIKGYNNMETGQDYDFLIKLVDMKYKIGFINECLISYRIRNNSISIKKRNLRYILNYAITNKKDINHISVREKNKLYRLEKSNNLLSKFCTYFISRIYRNNINNVVKFRLLRILERTIGC